MLIERAIWLGKPDLGIPAEAQGWRCTTPAKINLFLEVLGKRSDGYHDLDTVMHAIDLTDTLEIFPSSNSALTMSIDFSNAQQIERPSTPAPDPAWDIPSNRSNLILKAIETLRN